MTISDTASVPTVAGSALPTEVDPLCGMTVTVKDGTRSAIFGDQNYHFCSEKCQTRFNADPWFHASGNASKNGHAVVPAAQYTCPMHPKILQDRPAICPLCGMALEPLVASDEASPELADFTRRMWLSGAAGVPLVILTMGGLVKPSRCS